MTAPTCKVGDEIEIFDHISNGWDRCKIDRVYRVSSPREWLIRANDDGKNYWILPDDSNIMWRHAQAAVPVTEVCS